MAAAEWIQPKLGWRPNCRAQLGELVAEADQGGHSPASFEAELMLLAGDGRLLPEGPDVRLETPFSAWFGGNPDLVMRRIEGLGDHGIQSTVALHVVGDGYRVPAADRPEVAGDIAFEIGAILGLGDRMAEDALGEIRRCVEEVLDNPGSAYEIEGGTGDFVMLPCSP